MDESSPSPLRQILSDLPRKLCAFVFLVVIANLGVMALLRAHRVSKERDPEWWSRAEADRFAEEHPDCFLFGPFRPEVVAPWDWTAAEWRETVWAWK
jgi:hypothetical protein